MHVDVILKLVFSSFCFTRLVMLLLLVIRKHLAYRGLSNFTALVKHALFRSLSEWMAVSLQLQLS